MMIIIFYAMAEPSTSASVVYIHSLTPTSIAEMIFNMCVNT
jgi:hypothetical protein